MPTKNEPCSHCLEFLVTTLNHYLPLLLSTTTGRRQVQKALLKSIDGDLTSSQAAAILGIPARTMRRYLEIGKFPGIQNSITGSWSVSKSAIEKLKNEKTGV
jgi:hypothetical protein